MRWPTPTGSSQCWRSSCRPIRPRWNRCSRHCKRPGWRPAPVPRALRASLQPGLPCPVCGSTEHPQAQAAAAVDALLEVLESQAKASRRTLDEQLRQQAGAEAQRQFAAQALSELEAELAALAGEREATRSAWQAHERQADCYRTGLRPARALAGADSWQQCRSRCSRSNSARHSWRAAARARAAQLALDQARSGRDDWRLRVQALQQQAALTAQQLQAALQQRARIEQDTEALLEQLDAAFARAAWREQWLADPQAYCARLREQVQEWTSASERCAALQAGLQLLAQQADSRQQACEQAGRLEQTQAQALQQIEAELAQYRQQRAALFGGDPADQVTARLQSEVEQADQRQASALEALQQARRATDAPARGATPDRLAAGAATARAAAGQARAAALAGRLQRRARRSGSGAGLSRADDPAGHPGRCDRPRARGAATTRCRNAAGAGRAAGPRADAAPA